MASKEAKRSIKSSQPRVRGLFLNLKTGVKTFDFVDADVTVADDTIDASSHPYITGDRVQLTTTGVLPAGLAAATDYWVIKVNADVVQLASSLANALAGTAVNITGAAGGGTHTSTSTEDLDGLDSIRAHTLQVQSTGTYRIIFDPATPWGGATFYNVAATPITADVSVRVKAKTATYVEFEVKDISGAPAVADGLFEMVIFGSEITNRW
jgi:hypothetical protein